MKVLVLNGSPKGNKSITLYTVKYIQKYFPEDEFEVLNVGSQIKSLEKDFSSARQKILECDLILFSYPVYTFETPYQLHRFVELMYDNFKNGELNGKFASQITTSKHFYDITAHQFIKDISSDFGIKFIEGLYADMDDLPTKKGRGQALDYWRLLKWQIDYEKGRAAGGNVSRAENASRDRDSFHIKIVCDIKPEDVELKKKVQRFQEKFPYKTSIFNIAEYNFAAGCLGCFRCAQKGECVHRDGFADVLRNEILPCDGFIYAFTVQNHSCGSNFKLFDDRQFCNGHRTMSIGKPVGYIVGGSLEGEWNVLTMINAKAQVGKNILASIAQTDDEIDELTDKMAYLLEKPVSLPSNFYEAGGMRIFRDLIYVMGGFMKADYEFYKKQGFFDSLPTNQKKTRRLMKLVGKLMSNEKIMKKIGNEFFDKMNAPYENALKD